MTGVATARVEVLRGDITELAVDAIVNAANSSLLGGGGVDGAIHRRAGPELARAGRLLGGCRTGEAKLTPGFLLPARFVIHTVGPVWRGGGDGEAGLLAACYRSALEIAREQRFASIAFPAISTGSYGFPRSRAAEIAVHTLVTSLEVPSALERVILVAFDEGTERLYLERVAKLRPPPR